MGENEPPRDRPRLPEARSLLEFTANRHQRARWYRCASCGFLARAIGGEDHEVPTIVREAGMDTNGWTAGGLFCFVGAANIPLEIRGFLRDGNHTELDAVLDVVNRDRNCASWYPHLPGATPLWHSESLQMMLLEEMRAKREQELAALNLKMAEDSKAIAESLHQVTIATGKFTTKWTYIAFAAAILALIGVYLTYLFPTLGPTIGHWLLPSVQGTPKP